MNRPLLITALAFTTTLFVGCKSNDRVQLEGIPEFFASGAQISAEPEPFKPDPAFIPVEDESGPIGVTMITDKYRYPKPPEKKPEKKTIRDPLERGREYRIKRLFR